MITKLANKIIYFLSGNDVNQQIDELLTNNKNNVSQIVSKDFKIKELESKINDLSNIVTVKNKLQSQLEQSNKENAELNKKTTSIQTCLNEVKKLSEYSTSNYHNIIIAKDNEIRDLTAKVKSEEDQLIIIQDALVKEKRDFIREKQLMIDNNHHLTTEIKSLREKIKYRDQANADLRAERDSLQAQLKNHLDELALINLKEEEEEQLRKQRDQTAKVIIDAGIKQGEEVANKESETEIIADKISYKFDGLLEVDIDYVFENLNSHNGFIKWIFDAEDNKYYEVLPMFFLQNEAILVDLRRRLEDYCTNHQGKPKFVCAICYEPIKLSGAHGERGKVNCFVHSNDNINCPIKTGRNNNVRSFAESHQYQFSASSYRSKIIRDQLAVFLPKTMFVDKFNVEPIVSYNFNFAVWRKPHFTCEYKGQQLAFEVQTNPSTVKVITSRNLFYRKQNSFIIWVFDDSFASSKSLSLKDIFYANNHNMFVFDKIAHEKSNANNQLWLKCLWEEPFIDKTTISWVKKSDYITLDQLTYDTNNYIAYYFPSQEKFINLGGTTSYELDLNDNSFDDYGNTFENLQKANLERLKAKGVLTNEESVNFIENSEFPAPSIHESDSRIIDYDISYSDLNGIFICRQNNLWYKVYRETLIGELLPYSIVEEFLGVLKCIRENTCDLIEHDGSLLKSFECDNIRLFLDNQIIASSGTFNGWFNADFEEVLPIKFNNIGKFNEKYVFVKKDSICSLYFYNGDETSIQNFSSIRKIDDDNLLLFVENKWKIYSQKVGKVIIGPVSNEDIALKELKYLNRKVSETVINKQSFLYGTILDDKGDYFDVNMISISGKAKLNKVDVTTGTIKRYKALLDENKTTICKVILLDSKNDIAFLSQKIAKEKTIEMVKNALQNIGEIVYLEIIGTRNDSYYTVQNEQYYGTIRKDKLGDNAIGYNISAKITAVINSKTIAFELVEIISRSVS